METRQKNTGPWTDLYALGAVAYRCVSGKAPIAATARVFKDPLVAAVTLGNGRYNSTLLKIIDQALAMKPEDRFQSAEDMRAALMQCQQVITVSNDVRSRPTTSSDFHQVETVRQSGSKALSIPEKVALPPAQNIHGWAADKVKTLQKQTAASLGVSIVHHDTLEDGSQGPAMVVIPAGELVMGSPEDEPERLDDETQRTVTLDQPFFLGETAVTFAEYDQYCDATGQKKPNDRGWGRGDRPVINVSWKDAVAYCAWLIQETGERYQLPTEAQWEYACRAGTTTPFFWGNQITTDLANYDGDYPYNTGKKGERRGQTVPVKLFFA